MSEWEETTIGEFAPFAYGKGLTKRTRVEGKFRVYGSNGVVGTHNEAYVNSEGIIIGRKGSVGELHLSKKPFWPIDTTFFIKDEPSKRNLYFTYYMLKTIGLGQMNSDSAVPGLNREYAHLLEISVPPLEDQKAIAEMLGALDDKIELNRRMNETLEAMAQAIFKDWFVDFGPTRAKMEGLTPYLAPALWSLFPDSLNADGIPQGWKNDNLGSFTSLQNGYAFKSKGWKEEGVPVVKIGSVKPAVVDLNQVSFVSHQVAEECDSFRLGAGDVLVGLTGYVGETGRIPPTDCLPLLNQRVARFSSDDKFSPFVYTGVRDPRFKKFAESKSHGSAQANVSTKSLLEYPVVNPCVDLLDCFNEITAPMFDKSLQNLGEISHLGEIRDLLLPRLMSGKLRV